MEEQFGEDLPPMLGEGGLPTPTPHYVVEEIIYDKKLTFDEASRCLNTLGKDESGVRYAYLMITATYKKLTDVSIIPNFKHVLFLDLSDNYLNMESLQVLSAMPFLLYLKAERNRVESAALDPMPYLQCLILNKNQITETCDICQPMLETLELQENLIFTSQFDSKRLENLKMLNLRGNQLIDFSGFFPVSLEKLYLNQNNISKIMIDFSQLSNLKILNLRDNQIKKLNRFTKELENLTYLNLRHNKINKMREFRKLQCLPRLDTLIILENPVSPGKAAPLTGEGAEEAEDEEMFGEDQFEPKDPTRVPLLVLLPNLKRINKNIVSFEEKQEAELRRNKILLQIFDEDSSEEEQELPTTTEYTTDYTTETEPMYSTSFVEDLQEDEGDGTKKGTPATESVGNVDSPVNTSTIADDDVPEAPKTEEGSLQRIDEEIN